MGMSPGSTARTASPARYPMSAKSPVQIPAAAAAYPMSANMPAQTIA